MFDLLIKLSQRNDTTFCIKIVPDNDPKKQTRQYFLLQLHH